MSAINPAPVRRPHEKSLGQDNRGATAIEFALVLPLMVAIMVAVMEISGVMLEYQKATEATRRGARIALIGPSVPDLTNLATSDITCQGSGSSSVSCSGATVSTAATFATMVTEMQEAMPNLTASNIFISYTDSGVGSGITGAVTPMITVSLVNMTYTYLVASVVPGFPTSLTLPGFATTRLGATVIP